MKYPIDMSNIYAKIGESMNYIQQYVFGNVILHLDAEIRRLEDSVELSQNEELELIYLEMLRGFNKFREAFVDYYLKAEEKR